MPAGDPSPRPNTPRGFGRSTGTTSSSARFHRLGFRLIGIPVVAVCGVLIYRGLRQRFVLPDCDSGRARSTLADVFKQLKIEPLRYQPITTISSSKNQVVCKASLPLAGGVTLDVDYRFFWQGDKASMKYAISRREPPGSADKAPR